MDFENTLIPEGEWTRRRFGKWRSAEIFGKVDPGDRHVCFPPDREGLGRRRPRGSQRFANTVHGQGDVHWGMF
eukprot:8772820-Pyramimonas_sp.AAC.1